MKVHSIQLGKETPRYVLSIDPGFRSGGFALLDKTEGSVLTWGASECGSKILGVSFPDLFKVSRDRAEYFLSQLPRVDPEEIEVIIEHSMITGSFSLSLNVLVSVFLSMLVERKMVARVTLVQPRTSQWFLKLSSATPREVISFAERTFPPTWKDTKRWNSHAVDALLIMMFCHYDYFKTFVKNLREPKIELLNRRLQDDATDTGPKGKKQKKGGKRKKD